MEFRPVSVLLSSLLLLSLLLFAPVSALDLNIYEKDGRLYCGQGWKQTDDGITVLYLSGGPLQIGYQYGRLMDNLLWTARDFWLKQFPAFELNKLPPVVGKELSQVYLHSQVLPNLSRQIPEEYRTELAGMAVAAGEHVSEKEILRMQTGFDLYQFYDCAAFALREHATRSGNILACRNINSVGAGFIDRERIVCMYAPAEGLPFVTINPPGIAGAVDGMNANGIVCCFAPMAIVQEDLKNELFSLDGMPVVYLIRQALQYGTSFEEVIRILRESPRTRGGQVLVADAQSNRVALAEFSPEDFELLEMEETTLWATNHFRTRHFAEIYYDGLGASYKQRFFDRDTLLQEVLSDYMGRFSVSTAVAALRTKNSDAFNDINYLGHGTGSLSGLKTVGSVIFSPDDLAFWIPRPGVLPATENAYRGYTLYDYFKLEYERTVDTEGVPASEMTADASFGAVQDLVRGSRLKEEGKFEEAARYFEKGLAGIRASGNNYNLVHALDETAAMQRAAGWYGRCLESYTAILGLLDGMENTIELREIRVRTLVRRGMLYDSMKMRSQARQDYQAALRVPDLYYTGWRDRAGIFLKKPYEKKKQGG